MWLLDANVDVHFASVLTGFNIPRHGWQTRVEGRPWPQYREQFPALWNETPLTETSGKSGLQAISCYKENLQITVRNQTRNTVLADAAEVADTSAKRRVGLLKHDHLAPGQGLWIVPCESVHSFFMKFAIDLVYLDRKKKVRKVRHSMAPWRLSACLAAHSILELPAGAVAASGTQKGDQLEIIEH